MNCNFSALFYSNYSLLEILIGWCLLHFYIALILKGMYKTQKFFANFIVLVLTPISFFALLIAVLLIKKFELYIGQEKSFRSYFIELIQLIFTNKN